LWPLNFTLTKKIHAINLYAIFADWNFTIHFRDVELKKAYLDQSFRNYLIENLLANPEQADLDECTALITLSIKGIYS